MARGARDRRARSGERGSIRAALPDSDAQQEIFDERQTSDRLVFTIRTDKSQRTGVWSGKFDGLHNLSTGFRVQLSDVPLPLPTEFQQEPPKELTDQFMHGSARFPVEAPEVQELLKSVAPPSATDPLGQIRGLLAYVTDEIATASTASDDALLTLAAGEAASKGRLGCWSRCCARPGIPRDSPPACGCAPTRRPRKRSGPRRGWAASGSRSRRRSASSARARRTCSCCARAARRWSREPASTPCPTATACCASRCARGVASFMVPTNPLLAAVSLYRLPVGSQSALRILLVFPIGALIIALWRNLIGVRTFGTFMPLLISLALRSLPRALGRCLVASVIVLGIFSRLLLERLQLLLVPRLGVLLCIVVLAITAHSLLGRSYEVKDLFASVLFPVVILTMLIERFTITTAEEGLPAALRRLAVSTVVAMCVYPIFGSPRSSM